MPTVAEEAFRAELIKELKEINHLAGLGKYSVLPQEERETPDKIRTRQEIIGRRVQAITKTLEAMILLDRDGYPGVPVTEVDPSVYADLHQDIEDLMAALEGFAALPPAKSLEGTFGVPEPKEGEGRADDSQ